MQDQDFKNSEIKAEGNNLNLLNSNSFFTGIRFKIIRLVTLSAFAGILISFLFSFFVVRHSDKKNASSNLETIAQLKKDQLTQFLDKLSVQIKDYSKNEEIISAYDELKSAYYSVEEEFSSSDKEKAITDLNEFYRSLSQSLTEKTHLNFKPTEFIPSQNNSKILQYLYITNNQNAFGSKNILTGSEDNTTYTSVHGNYHKLLGNTAISVGADDILLIDPNTGNVIYSYKKYLDFSADLFEGPFSTSNLAVAIKEAIAKPEMVFSDIDLYTPALMKPVMFAAISFNSNQGVLVFQFSAARIKSLFNSEDDNAYKVYLAGEDFYLRTDDPGLSKEKTEYLNKLSKTEISKEKISVIDSLNSCINLVPLPAGVFTKAGLGYTDIKSFTDITGEKVMGAIAPVDLGFNKLYLITTANHNQLFKSSILIFKLGVPLLILLILALLLIAYKKGTLFSERLRTIDNTIKSIIEGREDKIILNGERDEIAKAMISINNLSSKIGEAVHFSTELATGNTSKELKSFSENDYLSKALNQVKNRLVEIKQKEENRIAEDEIRNWTTQGIAKFNEFLHLHNDDINNFTFTILKELIEYLSANQGGFFMINGDRNEDRSINLVASYAYDRRKYLTKNINIGEGLLGTCVLEKKFIYLKEIPDNYIEITSGLGHSTPKTLLIMPLIYDDEVIGLIELASLKELKKYEIEFIEKVAESIANTLHSVGLNEKTKILLQQSNERAEELSAQEEEMRQNLEELKATQEEMARIKEEDEKKEKIRREKEEEFLHKLQKNNEELLKRQKMIEEEEVMFQALMENLQERITFKDLESRYIRINKKKSAALGLKDINEVIGKTDYEVWGAEHHKLALEEEKELIKSGVPVIDKEEVITLKNGSPSWCLTSRIPLKDAAENISGILVISRDIDDIKNATIQLELQNKILHEISSSQSLLLYQIDKKGKIEKISGKILNTAALSENDFIGKEFSKIFPESGNIGEQKIIETGFSFISELKEMQLKHIIFENKATAGGFIGVAFIV